MTVPRDETDAAFETLVTLFYKRRTTRFASNKDADAFDGALTTIQDEMKRLQEDKASRGEMLDSTIATLKERTSQLTETRDQLEKERALADVLGADLWEARKSNLDLRDQLEKAKAEKP